MACHQVGAALSGEVDRCLRLSRVRGTDFDGGYSVPVPHPCVGVGGLGVGDKAPDGEADDVPWKGLGEARDDDRPGIRAWRGSMPHGSTREAFLYWWGRGISDEVVSCGSGHR